MTRLVTFAALLCAILVGSSVAMARPTAAAPQQCLNLTNRKGLNTGAVTQGLGLTVQQVKEMRARLAGYWGVRGFAGFDGLELTPQQIATMKARTAAQVAAMQKHPVGWPCKPFKNRARTLRFVRALLVGNGFTTYSIRFYGTSPRQIQFTGTQNGIDLIGTVARSGVREITVQLSAPRPYPGGTYVFKTPFDA